MTLLTNENKRRKTENLNPKNETMKWRNCSSKFDNFCYPPRKKDNVSVKQHGKMFQIWTLNFHLSPDWNAKCMKFPSLDVNIIIVILATIDWWKLYLKYCVYCSNVALHKLATDFPLLRILSTFWTRILIIFSSKCYPRRVEYISRKNWYLASGNVSSFIVKIEKFNCEGPAVRV